MPGVSSILMVVVVVPVFVAVSHLLVGVVVTVLVLSGSGTRRVPLGTVAVVPVLVVCRCIRSPRIGLVGSVLAL